MRRILIISPHFSPVNAPDMQRIRMSLPYYKALGWEPVVLCVDERYVPGFKDELLNETIPEDIEVHKLKAWPERFTRKFGFGSLSIRSYYAFKKKGSELINQKKFDLIFFSTSLFHVCALGRYWQKKFGIPFVVDMQDPWYNEFFIGRPRSEKSAKFWISHALDKRFEAYTMPYASGIISVSQGYIDTLTARYKQLKTRPALVLPFGTSTRDFDVVHKKNIAPRVINTANGKINVVYVGALNQFFIPVIKAFFIAFTRAIKEKDRYHFYFIGTNYARDSSYKPIETMAEELNISHLVTEVTERIPYFSALSTLLHSDILFIPGSIDGDYNASKVYNNIFTGKPIFSIFNEKSHVKKAIENTNAGIGVGLNENDDIESMIEKLEKVMPQFEKLHLKETKTNFNVLHKFIASTMVEKQVGFFNKIMACITPMMYTSTLNILSYCKQPEVFLSV